MNYRVCHGYQESNWAEFASWAQALEFAREMKRVYAGRKWHSVAIINLDKHDENTDGLSESERMEWLGV